jgi:hypothetical protein
MISWLINVGNRLIATGGGLLRYADPPDNHALESAIFSIRGCRALHEPLMTHELEAVRNLMQEMKEQFRAVWLVCPSSTQLERGVMARVDVTNTVLSGSWRYPKLLTSAAEGFTLAERIEAYHRQMGVTCSLVTPADLDLIESLLEQSLVEFDALGGC